jgi:hypothetical protein
MLELGLVLGVIGLIGSIIAFSYRFIPTTPSWLDWYGDLVARPEGDYNLILLIVAPIILIWGGFWIGEQIVLRRRFERMLDTPKRSEFSSRRSELDKLSKRLPDGYKARIAKKESEFVSKRST